MVRLLFQKVTKICNFWKVANFWCEPTITKCWVMHNQSILDIAPFLNTVNITNSNHYTKVLLINLVSCHFRLPWPHYSKAIMISDTQLCRLFVYVCMFVSSRLQSLHLHQSLCPSWSTGMDTITPEVLKVMWSLVSQSLMSRTWSLRAYQKNPRLQMLHNAGESVSLCIFVCVTLSSLQKALAEVVTQAV